MVERAARLRECLIQIPGVLLVDRDEGQMREILEGGIVDCWISDPSASLGVGRPGVLLRDPFVAEEAHQALFHRGLWHRRTNGDDTRPS